MIARLSQGVEFVIPAYAGTTNEKAWKSRRWRDGDGIFCSEPEKKRAALRPPAGIAGGREAAAVTDQISRSVASVRLFTPLIRICRSCPATKEPSLLRST